MHKVIIIGGGFAGLSAAMRLSRRKKAVSVTLIDRQSKFNFLPMLPDVIGRGVQAGYITNSLAALAGRANFSFLTEEARDVSFDKRQVVTSSKTLEYDFLIIAAGTETNFYGNEAVKQYAYKLDDAKGALKIVTALASKGYDTYIVAGGGYTGIEVATNLRLYLQKNSQDKKVIIVERAPSILGPLPEWMKEYVRKNLRIMEIESLCNTSIESIQQGKLKLSSGQLFNNAMLIWAAGVKAADFMRGFKADKNPQGRIQVDDYLRLNSTCFIAGDAAYVKSQDGFLRMAVQFAITQGESAAGNIINTIEGRPLEKYKPRDFGYIIPMANNRSCGIVFGINLKGYIPTLMHYLMCIYRAYSLKNKLGIVKSLLQKATHLPIR